ncbi:C6 zinc finger domain protein [Aspergillus terreus]|uniref:C6 zinc finger domain protein n=1 Tax=Aspergillus terreus TaxID=33178 RepID=A0A5M3ZA48_ASPTE|nr:hypothetical protein ATETN484_0011056800 [Aspergillus terreus]GFF19210.1 C6 zinc finger domain protein [Aspergillus terreus]
MLSTSNSHPGQPAARLARADSPVTGPRHHQQQEQQQPSEDIPSVKRRRVRKGTRSCWECKRRKIRCLFARPDDATCIGCQHRRSPCVGQDMPEDLSPARRGNGHLSNRVARIEEVMKDWLLAQSSGSGATIAHGAPSLSEPASHASPVFLPTSPHGYGDDPSETESIARSHLLAALPSPSDVQILLRESARPSLYTVVANMHPRSRLTPETLASVSSPTQAEDLVGSHSHPVLLAKQMLLFAITLQSPCGQEVLGPLEPSSVLIRRLTTAASMWVTTRDEMQGTVDALACIIFEAIIQTNAGNLRRAWAVYRRALTVAQLMGLHRSPRAQLPRIDSTFEADPECLWFRIVYMDRYLSLLLGLPQGTADQSMGTPAILRQEPPLGQFERNLTVLASRILRRNDTTFVSASEIPTIQALDAELLAVSQSMPPSFWRPPNFQHLTLGAPETLMETVRLGVHVYYHGLLIHLHLPYMTNGMKGHLSNGSNETDNPSLAAQHESSKMTCVNASREIMTRFIAHRTFNPMSSCSRPVDFFALLAGMTLLLAHLDAHHHRGGMATNCLAHQRLGDRAMLDQALERLDAISHLNKDVTAQQSAALIRRLMDIEADTARGDQCQNPSGSVRSSEPRSGDFRTGGIDAAREPGSDYDLLSIPYLKAIWNARACPIAREPSSEDDTVSPPRPSPTMDARSHITVQNTAMRSTDMPTLDGSTQPLYEEPPGLNYPFSSADSMTLQQPVGLPSSAAGVNDWAFQGVDMAFFDASMITIDEWFGFTKNILKLPKYMIFNDLRNGPANHETRGTDLTYCTMSPVGLMSTNQSNGIGSLFTVSGGATYAGMKVEANVEVKGEASSELDTSATETLLREGRIGDRPVHEIILGMNIRVRQVYYWQFNDEYELWYRFWAKQVWDFKPKKYYETSWHSGPSWDAIHAPDSQLRRVDKLVHSASIYYQLLPVLKNGQIDGLHVANTQPGLQVWYAFTNGTGTHEVLGPKTKA